MFAQQRPRTEGPLILMPARSKRPLLRNDLRPIRMKSEWKDRCHQGTLFLGFFFSPPFLLFLFFFFNVIECGFWNRYTRRCGFWQGSQVLDNSVSTSCCCCQTGEGGFGTGRSLSVLCHNCRSSKTLSLIHI